MGLLNIREIAMNTAGFFSYINNLPYHLDQISETSGIFVYVIVAVVLLLETGGVVTNFLPGDTLVFACAALCASTDLMDIIIIIPLSLISSFLGDFLNFNIGRAMGKLYLKRGKMKLISKEQFEAARKFIAERGRKGFLINRFIPLARVYVLFLTGFLQTDYQRIFPYHLTGVIIWNAVYLTLGYFFGNIPFVRNNFFAVIIGILALSVIPATIIFIKNFSTIKESDLYKSFFGKKETENKNENEKENDPESEINGSDDNINHDGSKTSDEIISSEKEEDSDEPVIDEELFEKDIFEEEEAPHEQP